MVINHKVEFVPTTPACPDPEDPTQTIESVSDTECNVFVHTTPACPDPTGTQIIEPNNDNTCNVYTPKVPGCPPGVPNVGGVCQVDPICLSPYEYSDANDRCEFRRANASDPCPTRPVGATGVGTSGRVCFYDETCPPGFGTAANPTSNKCEASLTPQCPPNTTPASGDRCLVGTVQKIPTCPVGEQAPGNRCLIDTVAKVPAECPSGTTLNEGQCERRPGAGRGNV